MGISNGCFYTATEECIRKKKWIRRETWRDWFFFFVTDSILMILVIFVGVMAMCSKMILIEGVEEVGSDEGRYIQGKEEQHK